MVCDHNAESGGMFGHDFFNFLSDLKQNNQRDWFAANKMRYENLVKAPALNFIQELAPLLLEVSPHFVADRSSMFRIHRDTRFGADKSPYKTHVGLHFRHEVGKDAHAPGFYLHLEPEQIFIGAGIWHPQQPALGQIRQAIALKAKSWETARQNRLLEGDSLKRPPAGFDANHPFIEDIKRKDFFTMQKVSAQQAARADFVREFAQMCAQQRTFIDFLCGALGLSC